MHYAILCYHDERVVEGWSKEQDDAVIAHRQIVQKKLAAEGKLGPVARLMPTTAATTLRAGRETIVLDGPFAETKEYLGGFTMLDAKDLNEALQLASRLPAARLGSIEVRPILEPAVELTDTLDQKISTAIRHTTPRIDPTVAARMVSIQHPEEPVTATATR